MTRARVADGPHGRGRTFCAGAAGTMMMRRTCASLTATGTPRRTATTIRVFVAPRPCPRGQPRDPDRRPGAASSTSDGAGAADDGPPPTPGPHRRPQGRHSGAEESLSQGAGPRHPSRLSAGDRGFLSFTPGPRRRRRTGAGTPSADVPARRGRGCVRAPRGRARRAGGRSPRPPRGRRQRTRP